jgi:HD-like signal output (HDOD) protein
MTPAAADPATLADAAERVAQGVGIPPCPEILVRFSAEMLAAEPDLRALSGLICSDAALAASLLKTVNSAFYGLETKAKSVQQALSILGLRAAANLVTALLLKQAFPSGEGSLMRRFWDETTSLAALAGRVARRLGTIEPDEAHTFVLFRDCGKAVMLRRYPVYAITLDAHKDKPGRALVVAETSRFRFCHARVGYSLAREWLLPEPMCKAILYHHARESTWGSLRDHEPVDPRLIAFGLLVEQLVSFGARKSICPDWPENEAFVLAKLGITADEIVELAGELEVLAA